MQNEPVFYKLSGHDYTIIAATTDNFTIITDITKSSGLIKELNEHSEIVDLDHINLAPTTSKPNPFSHCQQPYWIRSPGCPHHCYCPGTWYQPQPYSPAVSPTVLTPAEKIKYRETIGCLLYAPLMTHPDIALAVSTLPLSISSDRERFSLTLRHQRSQTRPRRNLLRNLRLFICRLGFLRAP